MLRTETAIEIAQSRSHLMMKTLLAIVVTTVCLTLPLVAQSFNSVWEASSHQHPDSICPGWISSDNADPENPSFEGDTLVISTSAFAENMFYVMNAPYVTFPDPVVVEFTMKYVSGDNEISEPSRRACHVYVGTGSQNAAVLYFGKDETYLWSGFEAIGDSDASDTDSIYHTYRIEVTAAGAVSVFKDNLLLLSGSTFNHFLNPVNQQIYWGDGTGNAYGESRWINVKHNAYAFDFDQDGDVLYDSCDNCPLISNSGQEDLDGDGVGDVCDGCPTVAGDQCYNASWYGSSQELPSEVCPQWELVIEDGALPPVMVADTLVISTTSGTLFDYEYFEQLAPAIQPMFPVVLEFRMRLVSSEDTVDFRTAAGSQFFLGGDTSNALFIGSDEIFLLSSQTERGQTASVDTDNSFHTYRVEIDNLLGIRVFYDGQLTLTGSMFEWQNAGVAGFNFGDVARQSRGESRWLFVRHNSYAQEADEDNDSVVDVCDNCVSIVNIDQADLDGDGRGDVCDNCVALANPNQADCDNDGIGDACESFLSGDADHSGAITISDAVYLINYIFSGGPAPCPLRNGDSDCSGSVTISDAVYLISYIFSGGPAPC